MKIESLKHLLAEKIDYDEEYFSHNTYKEALFIALRALENISDMGEYYDTKKMANTSIKEIEKIFD